MIMQQNGGAFFGVIPILPPVYRGICHAKSAKPEDVFEFSMHTEGKEEPSGQFFRGNRQHNLQAVEGNHNTQQQCPKSAPAKPTAEHARQSAFSAFKATAKKQQPWIFSILPNLNPWIFSIFGVLKPWIISNWCFLDLLQRRAKAINVLIFNVLLLPFWSGNVMPIFKALSKPEPL